MLQDKQQVKECWVLNLASADTLSSQSSVSGGKQQQQQQQQRSDSTSSVLKEHDYIGLSEVTSPEMKQHQEKSKPTDLQLQETELRLGPHPVEQQRVKFTNNGAPFQPKIVAAAAAAAATAAGGKKPLNLGFCYSEADSTEAAKNAASGSKRVFAQVDHGTIKLEAGVTGGGGTGGLLSKHPLLPPLYPWKAAKQSFHSPRASSNVGEEAPQQVKDKEEVPAAAARTPVVGWPPVQSFRKQTLAVQPSKEQTESNNPAAAAAAASPPPITATATDLSSSSSVKVYMDGVSIGRKVAIKSLDSYEKLSSSLEDMFGHQISGASKEMFLLPDKKLNFLSGSDYVLTYEDKDGDLMLVGDVPWNMFKGTVKRLRIMKGSDAIGLVTEAA